jgi:tetratricopeptide (TPR) repeat protein
MKKILIISFSLLITTLFTSFATNHQESFLQANEFYKQSKFKEACELYSKIPNKSPQIYYNMGNCSYKLGNFGYAMLYWRKAEKNWGMFNREELVNNINLLDRQLFEQQHKNDDPEALKAHELKFTIHKIKTFLVSIINSLPLLLLQLIFLLFWILLLVYKKYLYKNQKKLILVSLFVILVSSGSMIALRYGVNIHETAIVVVKQSEVFSGPDKTYQQVGSLPEATAVIVKKQSEKFCKIKWKALVGWVDSTTIEKI